MEIELNNNFTVFPAIDLRGGKVVRLLQGNPDRQTAYGADPLYWAERWKSAGAQWLHVINLDGAFGDDIRLNMQALASLLKVGIKIEFGGGMRDRNSISTALALGVQRIFLGTATIRDPELVDWAIAAFGPGCIAGDIGGRAGKVFIQGWQEATGLSVLELGKRLSTQGLEWCVLTNVRRDGVGAGIDVTGAVKLQQATSLKVVASGGVRSLNDVNMARSNGLAGIIIGRALYEGHLSLKECLRDRVSMLDG